jgi:putative tricarboxylic transport membrane protein
MKNPRPWLAAAAAVLLALLVPPVLSAGGEDTGTRIRGLRFLVPNAPGGGYDITARTAAKAVEDAGLNGDIEVFNLPGAGGTVGLGRIVGERGNGRLVMSMGLGVVGSVYTNKTPSTLGDTTPIARLTEESDVIAVGRNSPYRTIGQLIEAWKADPGEVPVGGGSSPGGPDHLAPMLMARAVGIAPRRVNYVPYDGAASSPPPCWAARSASGSPASARPATRSPRGNCAPSPSPEANARPASTPRRSRSPAWTSTSPTGAGSSLRRD